MARNTEPTYDEVLDHLFSEERLSISLLYRLSDLSPEDLATLAGRWPQASEERRRIIARHMADICEENFIVDFAPVFQLFMQDPVADVRLAALDGLWDFEHASLLPPVIELMESDVDPRVRALAAATLGHIVLFGEWGQLDIKMADRATEAMLAVYHNPQTPEVVRRAALESFGASANEQVPDLISHAYHSGSDQLQLSAVVAMGRNAHARWLPIIMDELESDFEEMREEAARSAGGIGSSDAVEKLIELLEDDELDVRLAAVHALSEIGSDQAQEALQELLDNPGTEEVLLEAIENSLEEMDWLGSDLDFSLLEWNSDEDGLSV